MSSEAVIFDMEGVWLRGGSTPDRFYRETADQLLGRETVERLSDGEYMTLLWFEDEEEYRELCEREGLDPEAFWEKKENRVEALEQEAIENGERGLVEDVETVFEVLGEDYAIGVVSNNTRRSC
jgi:FMN phosphatase YigB (HAD superfamily)